MKHTRLIFAAEILFVLVLVVGITWLAMSRGKPDETSAIPPGIDATDQMFAAVISSDADDLRQAIDNGAQLESRRVLDDRPNRSALIVAIDQGNVELLRILLDAGADPNSAAAGWEPITFAARKGHADIVQEFLDRGVYVDGDAEGQTPLSQASARKHNHVVQQLVNAGAEMHAEVMYGAAEGNPEALGIMLDAGADPDIVGYYGQTPLTMAAVFSVLPSIELLLDAGADPLLADSQGKTPVLLAAQHGLSRAVELLLEAGADPNTGDELGITPLIAVATNNDAHLARQLVKAGVNVNARDIAGRTAIMHISGLDAATMPLLTVLLRAGADPTLTDDDDRDVLEYISRKCEGGAVRMIKNAIAKGGAWSSPSAPDSGGS